MPSLCKAIPDAKRRVKRFGERWHLNQRRTTEAIADLLVVGGSGPAPPVWQQEFGLRDDRRSCIVVCRSLCAVGQQSTGPPHHEVAGGVCRSATQEVYRDARHAAGGTYVAYVPRFIVPDVAGVFRECAGDRDFMPEMRTDVRAPQNGSALSW